MVTFVGRDRMFGFMARRLDRNQERKEQDGAFVAGLLDCWELSPGQAWWLHRKEPNLAFVPEDPRRNWLQGRVVQIDGTGFHVFVD